MHPIQRAILDLAGHKNLADMTLKAIGREATGELESAQLIQYHMERLFAAKLLRLNKQRNIVERVSRGDAHAGLVSLPLYGNASMGPATAAADDVIESYVQVSRRMVGNDPSSYFLVRAVGHSMNKANIGGLSINDGDYVIVDKKDQSPKNGDYILSVIDGHANVKRFHRDNASGQITLFSESTEKYEPIYIHPDDPIAYVVSGKVKYVIKKPTVTWS